MAKKVLVQGMVPPPVKEDIVRLSESKGMSISEFVWLMLALALKEKLHERF